MKFSIATSALLLASSAVAAPNTHHRRAQAEARAEARRSRPMHRVSAPADIKTNKTNVSYSSNWSGAVLIGTGYTSVTATFKAPTIQSTGSGSAWVGIDGDTCSSAILQTGIDWTRSSGGSVTYDAWYEWFPDYEYNFSGIAIYAGDTIQATVTATGTYSGTATVKNLSRGYSQTHTFTGQTEGGLCYKNAEWIVEDYESGGSLVPFANYGTVQFTGCSAKDNGNTVGVTGAQIIDMKQGSNVVSQCSDTSSTVTCNYV